MSTTIDARAQSVQWMRPFARFETQKQARDATSMGVIGLLFQGLGCVVMLFRLAHRRGMRRPRPP